MRKVVFFLSVFLLVLFIGSAFAANSTNSSTNTSSSTGTRNTNLVLKGDSEETRVDKAYQCLEAKVKDNTRLSLQESIFTVLAIGNKKSAVDKIESEKGTNCWPRAGCKLKETAQVALAYDRIGKNTDEMEKWIAGKNSTTNELAWYLQIDISNHVPGACSISYDGGKKGDINIGEDMKLTGTPGSCFAISSNGYWLRIADACISKEFQISCNQDFITNLLYQKKAGETVYVSAKTSSQASLGTTTEKIEARCLKSGSTCDYEGTLWGAYALAKTGNNVDSYVPYLLALAEDNTKYFPASLIYAISGDQDKYNDVIQAQKQGQFWEMTATPYGRYYDTSLAMLALQSSNANELSASKNYLLGIQGNSGCWNSDNIRDTSFILYSGWQREVAGGSSGGNGSGSGVTMCSSASPQYGCSTTSECIDAGGQVLYDFECSSAIQFCCTVKPSMNRCTDGRICPNGQECTGRVESTLDGSCCLDSCAAIDLPSVSECETDSVGVCRDSCGSDETEESASCSDSNLKCCASASSGGSGSGSGSGSSSNLWLWIILFLILIALVALAIVYREKLKFHWFKFKGRASSQPVERGMPPAGFVPTAFRAKMPPTMPGRMPSRGPPGPAPGFRPIPTRGPGPAKSAGRPTEIKPTGDKETEMDETFKKLKDMSE